METSYTHLSLSDRALIQAHLSQGLKLSQIAAELARNGWTRPVTSRARGRPPIAGGYRAEAAQHRAYRARVKPRVARRLMPGGVLWNQVMAYLCSGHSPEQIAGTLARVRPQTPSLQVSHETIYTAIYAMPRGELRTQVIGWLRQGHAKRRPRVRGEDRRGCIPDMLNIRERPPEVEERLVPGHWEGDLIKGAYNRSSVGTLVERTTLYTVLVKMVDARAETAAASFAQVLNRIQVHKRLSMTYDQGREMAAHAKLTEATEVKVYFADPHSPWQRGINENTNGLLRR